MNLEEARAAAKAAQNEAIAAKEVLKAAEDKETEAKKVLAYYMEVEKYAAANAPLFRWTEPATWRKEQERYFKYNSITMEFIVSINFNDKLKLYKYEVKAYAKQKSFTGSKYHLSDYTSASYDMMKKYINRYYDSKRKEHIQEEINKERPTTKKFKSLREALIYADGWRMTFINDNKEAIEQEKADFGTTRSQYNDNKIVVYFDSYRDKNSFEEYMKKLSTEIIVEANPTAASYSDSVLVHGQHAKAAAELTISQLNIEARIKAG